MNKFLFFSILLLVGCHEQTTKQQEKQVENSSVQVLDGNVLIVEWNLMFLIHL